MFYDEVTIRLQAGKGGDGSASFRHEKYVPRGGPDGGDGGRGGSVFIQASRQKSDLAEFASLREMKAENGMYGTGQKCFGRNGDDLTIEVPMGTRVYRLFGEEWKQVADLTEEGKSVRLLQGGKGGLGNVHFATATNQAPKYAEPGQPGQKGEFRFELQLIADVGIIGLPNAGKSTFISAVSDAKPKIANYPFTTLSPVLGVVAFHYQRFVCADIPGLIEGASHGKGLGHVFLRHVRRTKMLLHFIDALSDDYARDYATIQHELANYAAELLKKPELIVITKAELITPDMQEWFDENYAKLQAAVKSDSAHNGILFAGKTISAVTHQNLNELLSAVSECLAKVKPEETEEDR